jgi:hypothetical protein
VVGKVDITSADGEVIQDHLTQWWFCFFLIVCMFSFLGMMVEVGVWGHPLELTRSLLFGGVTVANPDSFLSLIPSYLLQFLRNPGHNLRFPKGEDKYVIHLDGIRSQSYTSFIQKYVNYNGFLQVIGKQ